MSKTNEERGVKLFRERVPQKKSQVKEKPSTMKIFGDILLTNLLFISITSLSLFSS